MNVNPPQYDPEYDPEFQDPNAADANRQSQFGMPLAGGTTGAGPTSAPVWGQRDVIASAPVYGSDDKKIGTVQESYTDSFKVKSGILLLAHDYYYPYSVIAHSDPERIVLNLTSDEAKHQNWRQPPPADTAAPTQGDMVERGMMGPNNVPAAPDHEYNPGLQGNSSGLLQPEEDPTSWNQDQQHPIPGV